MSDKDTTMEVGRTTERVLIEFPVPVKMLQLTAEQADQLSMALHLQAEQLRAEQAEREGKVH